LSESGPTTVGSIVGKLKLDREQWLADVAATKAEARQLAALEPDIHIDDNAAAVIGRMGAVATAVGAVGDRTDKVSVAQGRLTAAMSAADSAYARANVAQLRLNELREKGVTGGARLAAAELSVSEAMKRLESSNDKVTASELALAAARRTAAAAANDEAVAVVKANEANKTSVTRVGAIVTAIALLVPLLSPVAAAAVGLGGAFLGMGAAGILAIVGIKREMEAGTSTGQAYSAGLNTLGGIMSKLSQTAAVAMLASFRRSVVELQSSMPQLNTQVGQFSSLLGQSGASALSGTINSLRVLNPLFLTAGVYVRSLAEGFERWSKSGGIEDFGGYALANLPKVTELLGRLATMVMHILQALAPLGTVGMAVLVGIADVISAIPVDVLSQLIVTLTWGAVAFKAWGFVAPMLANIATSMGAVGAATTIATGPIGWVVAGLAALAGIFAVVIANNTGATQAMQDYTAAVDADTGAIGDNVRAKAAQKLLDSGAYDIAKKYGISVKDVTAAVLNETGARKSLNAQIEAQKQKLATVSGGTKDAQFQAIQHGNALRELSSLVNDNSDAITGEIGRYNTLQSALEDTTSATKAQQWADEAAAGALGTTASALQAARAGQEGVESATAKATAEMYVQNDAAGLLRQALDLLNGKQLSAAEAQNQFESQLVRLPQFTDEAAAALDGMSASAVDNRGSLLNLIQSSEAAAVAYRDQGASSEEARQRMIDGKQAIIEQAVANGMNRDTVTAYVDSLYTIPATVPKTQIEVDTAKAEAQLQGFLAQVSNQVAWIQVRATMPDLNGDVSGNGRPGVAMGGTIRGLAGGGSGGTVFGPGNAGSDTAGLFRLANGEEVISNRFGQADRNRALLKQMNAGYTPPAGSSTYGGGSAHQPTTAVAKGDTIVNINVTGVQNEDPRIIARIVGREVRDVLSGMSR
jgi:hypothetical protein